MSSVMYKGNKCRTGQPTMTLLEISDSMRQ